VGVVIAPDRTARLQAGGWATYMAFMRADCKWRNSALRSQGASSYGCPYLTLDRCAIFRPALIGCVRGPCRAMRSHRVAAQLRGEFPQIDRICLAIVGIGMAKFV
jgi:hypothetical protein